MENVQRSEEKKTTSKAKPKVNTTPIRVLKTTAKRIKGMVQKANKKPFGKKIRVDDILEKALSLIGENHLEEIKEASLTNADKLEMQFREYCRQNGNVSKDEFLGKLLNGGMDLAANGATGHRT